MHGTGTPVVPPSIWKDAPFDRHLSLKDWDNLSRAQYQKSIELVYGSDSSRALVQALQACIPELKAALVGRQDRATVHGVPPRKLSLLNELRTVVSVLEQAGPWGPALAAAPGLLVECSQLLSVPQLPREVIAHFVQHAIGERDEGLRICYQQLITAARNQIAGIEIWAQAQEECMGTQMDIPELAMAICWEEVSEELLVSSEL